MWELWRSRCSSRYDEERTSITRSTYQISFNICHLTKKIFPNLDIPDDWEKFLKLMETNFAGTTSFPIKWIRPSSPFVKMNSDGTCVRNSSGGWPSSFHLEMEPTEASAFLFCLKWCIDNGYNNITGETDSLLLQNCIQNFWSSPWRIIETVEEIRKLVCRYDIQINHCFKEANKVADKLASMSHSINSVKIYTDHNSLPRKVKGLFNLDRWQFPSFRTKRKKPSLIYFDPP
uniref:RNase H family protein n=1 Tax=Solanum tuberosum TaxID=4113 RepID=M1D3M3_SOLTU